MAKYLVSADVEEHHCVTYAVVANSEAEAIEKANNGDFMELEEVIDEYVERLEWNFEDEAELTTDKDIANLRKSVAPKVRIIVETAGGCVLGVHCNYDLEYDIVDWDDVIRDEDAADYQEGEDRPLTETEAEELIASLESVERGQQ